MSTCSRCGAVRIRLSLGEPSAEIVGVEALSLWRFYYSRNGLLKLLSQSRGRGFDSPLVRGSSSQLLSMKVVGEVHFRSSGWKIATFKYEASTRSKLSQLRRNF